MSEHVVASAEELSEGDRLLVQLEGREIGVFRIEGELHAYTNWCAHQAGPVCEGHVTGTTEASFDSDTLETELDYCREDEILNCPWHGWEYDLTSGECLSRGEVELPSYPVEERDGDIVITL